MVTKDIIGLALLFFAVPASIVVCCVSHRVRAAAFFLMLAMAPLAHKLDMNFFSHYWYRGTTRGLEISAMDVLAVGVLAGSVLLPPPGQRRWFWPASFGLLLLFFAYAGANVCFSDPRIYGVFELSKMVRGLIFFLAAAMFIRGERELSLLVLALGCAVCFEGALAVKERLLGGVFRTSGTLNDPNSFSMYLCAVSPIFVAAATARLPKFVRWFATLTIAVATICIVLTLSRAGIPIFAFIMLGAAAFCVSWRPTPGKIAAVALATLAVGVLAAKQAYLFEARWAHDSLAKEYDDPNKFESRGYYLRIARVILDDRPFLGVGLNNWSYWVSKKYGAQIGTPYEDYDDLTYAPSKQALSSFHYAAPAHCLAALTVGELGLPGLLIFFGLVWPRWFQMGASFLRPRTDEATRRLGIGLFFCTCGIFLQSVTEWVYRQEQIFITFHILIGALAALYWLKKPAAKRPAADHEWREPQEEEQPEYETAIA